MGCNCKASSYITRVERGYGYKAPTKKNVKVSSKIKMILQAFLIWIILILVAPIFLIALVFSKIFKKDIKILKKIRIRI